jgi:hypothetical protein
MSVQVRLGRSWNLVKREMASLVDANGVGGGINGVEDPFASAWQAVLARVALSCGVNAVCEEFKVLLYTYCLMASSTAEVERGFSKHANTQEQHHQQLARGHC